MDVWFENYAKLKVRPSSHQTYQGYINNHIKPNIGDIPIEKLTSLELQKLYKKLLTNGRVPRIEAEKQPKGLSAKTVRNINQVISSAMDMAVEQRIILTNPTNGCALPKVEHKEMHTIPAEQLNAFLREAKNSGVYELYYLDLATGLRRGELLGLKWSDIDLKTGIIHVKRQVARVNGEIKEVPLKTKNSYRNIAISKAAVEMLSEMKSRNLSEYVFPSATGEPISPDSVNNMLHRVLKRAGLPSIRFHDMRHTFATLALQNGVDIKTVSGMLGHFSAGFTLDTYAHVTTGAQREAANTMGNVLSGV
jgi:integrase